VLYLLSLPYRSYVHGFKQRKNVLDLEAGADVERRYGRLYDEGINPFTEFQV